MANVGHELFTGGDVAFEITEHGACDHTGVMFLDASHYGAEVGRLEDHPDPARLNQVFKEGGNLVGHPFLDLEPAGKHFYQAWNLGEADHLRSGQVADVCIPKERNHMVFAHTVKLDVLYHDHLVVLDVEQRVIEQRFWIYAVALK